MSFIQLFCRLSLFLIFIIHMIQFWVSQTADRSDEPEMETLFQDNFEESTRQQETEDNDDDLILHTCAICLRSYKQGSILNEIEKRRASQRSKPDTKEKETENTKDEHYNSHSEEPKQCRSICPECTSHLD